MIKKSRQKFKYLENEKNFYDEIKLKFFINSQGLSVAKNVDRPETASLNTLAILPSNDKIRYVQML